MYVNIDVNSYLCPHNSSRAFTCSSHNFNFHYMRRLPKMVFFIFFLRTIRSWNNLPKDIVESTSLVSFKDVRAEIFNIDFFSENVTIER